MTIGHHCDVFRHQYVFLTIIISLFVGLVEIVSNAAASAHTTTMDEHEKLQFAFYDRLARSVGPDGEYPSAATILTLLAEHDMHLHGKGRQARTLEGAACLFNNGLNLNQPGVTIPPAIGSGVFPQQGSPCYDFPLTICNPTTAKCICDVSLAVRLPLLPGYTFCIPIRYTINTRRCLPTEPDICGVAFPGSKCIFNNDGNEREWRCQCLNGGELGACRFFIGMSCFGQTGQQVCASGLANGLVQQVVQTQPTNSMCNTTSAFDSTATCVCAPGTEPTRDLQRCISRQCPIIPGGGTQIPAGFATSPCKGQGNVNCFSPGQVGYMPNSGRYFCQCSDIGIHHSEYSDGICCALGSFPCADYSACIPQSAVCDGIKNCQDCSDEAQLYCARPLAAPIDPMCRRFPQIGSQLPLNPLLTGINNGGFGRAGVATQPNVVTSNSGVATSSVISPTGKSLPPIGDSTKSGQNAVTTTRVLEVSVNSTAQQQQPSMKTGAKTTNS